MVPISPNVSYGMPMSRNARLPAAMTAQPAARAGKPGGLVCEGVERDVVAFMELMRTEFFETLNPRGCARAGVEGFP